MRLLATHTVHHPSEDKYLRLYQGDLARIPPGEAVDLLVVSALPNDYAATDSSVIGALDVQGISVEELAQDKQEDLRKNFSSWVSKDLSQRFPAAGFRRLLCFESLGGDPPPKSVGNIFLATMPFVLGEQPIRTIAMPIIAAGDQGYDAGDMLRALFDAAAHWLAFGPPVKTIKLVVYQEEKVEYLTRLFSQLSRDFPGSKKEDASASERDASVSNQSVSHHKYDLFLSYASSDAQALDVLEDGVKAANPLLRMYRYERELDPGRAWQEDIEVAIESCRRVVTLISPAYFNSRPCKWELSLAKSRHIESDDAVLWPIFLRDTPLPRFIQVIQYLDCREADAEQLLKAANKLATL